MSANIENQTRSRIEFGQARDIEASEYQLNLGLENINQITIFDPENDPVLLQKEDSAHTITSLKNGQDINEKIMKHAGDLQLDFKMHSYSQNIEPDQLWLHYTDNDRLGFDEEETLEYRSNSHFRKSALYSRRRNRNRQF